MIRCLLHVLVLAVAGGVLVGVPVMANDPDDPRENYRPQPPLDSNEAASSEVETSADLVDQTHDVVESYVQQASEAVDRFFSNEDYFDETNQTTVLLRLDTDWIEHEGVDFRPGFKLQLKLPRLTSKLNRTAKLVINAGEESTDDEEDRNPVAGGGGDGDDNSAALRLTGVSSDKWRLSFDVGVRERDWSLSGLGRVYVRRRFALPGNWESVLRNRFYWYTDTGWRNDFRATFDRLFGTDPEHPWLFRSVSRADWREDKDGAFVDQYLSFYNRLSDKQAIAYQAFAQLNTAASNDDDVYGVNIRWRTNYKYDWLFFEVWPKIGFPEKYDYDLTFSVRLRVEAFFGARSPKGPVKLSD